MFRCRFVPRLTTLAALRMLTITPVPMPALSPTMERGKITEWVKKPGDSMNSGDTYCKVETDKAVVTYDNVLDEGFFARVIVPENQETVVGETICLLVDEQSGVNSSEVKNWKPDGAAGEEAPPAAAAEPAKPAAESTEAPAKSAGEAAPGGRVKASPLARKLAQELGVELSKVKGTSSGGRISAKDVEAAAAAAPAAKAGAGGAAAAAKSAAPAAAKAPAKPADAVAAANPNYTDIPVTNMRAVIAKRLHQSKNLEIPHYVLFDDCCVDNMIALVKQLNAKGDGKFKITLNDYVIKAVARANTLVPEANASWQGSFIRQYHTVDVSVAVATPAGLITPIIRNAQAKGLAEISQEVKALAQKARENTLQPNEFQGGTCAVSNLGATGIPGFSAIINPPQAFILAVGAAKPRPQIVRNAETGEFEMSGKVESVVRFTASFDHRVVDGAIGARWFQGFKDAIENPLSLLL